jgi:hypothetical protein
MSISYYITNVRKNFILNTAKISSCWKQTKLEYTRTVQVMYHTIGQLDSKDQSAWCPVLQLTFKNRASYT